VRDAVRSRYSLRADASPFSGAMLAAGSPK